MQYQGVVVYSMADVPLVSFPNQDTARSANEDISSLPVFISDTLNWAVLLLLHLHVVFLHKIATTPLLFNVSKQNALCAVFFFHDYFSSQGFGVAAKSTQDCRRVDPLSIVVFHQADVGEFIRNEDTLT